MLLFTSRFRELALGISLKNLQGKKVAQRRKKKKEEEEEEENRVWSDFGKKKFFEEMGSRNFAAWNRGRGGGSRIGLAVVIGISLGFFWAYLFPHDCFTHSAPHIAEKTKITPALAEKLQTLEEKMKVLKEENSALRRKEASLKGQLQESEQERQAAKIQLMTAPNLAIKSGLFGTVRSVRANPVLDPDEGANPELNKLLSKIAINKEVIVAISNNMVQAMLKLWFESIQRAGITNYLVVALDDDIAQFCKEHSVPVYRRDAVISKAQTGTGDNHAISGLKFHLLREFLVLGYSVLLSDVDVLYLQNPFHHLYRDCDVESMSDGFNNVTAYGFDDVSDDPSMGWARYAHTIHIWVFNSGLFYIRPTVPAIELLDRVTARLSKEKAWDQAVFNEELFFPSRPGYEGLHASKRVMDYLLFLNSKVLFKILRKDKNFTNHKPVTIHINYHPDKFDRMLGIIDYYVYGKKQALDRFPDGSV
ncbi:hypothetical protein O6H91_20G036000 [Diphasiastrum complanatum]|uniref:Uncharacterized protein n=1 Tax=Diphasiastrum complanatum TaxID=34168 RepID=A0ACC2AP93_DIPCM|nr:hypothetical protein O6H91_20G036000 [Diphasiastrum complanatum]